MATGKEVDSLLNIFDRAVDQNNFISTFILGHLWIESLLFHILKLKTEISDKALERLTHAKLIDKVESECILSSSQIETLRAINRTRNKIAHNISYDMTISEYKSLIELAQEAFSDMTDGLLQTLEELEGKNKISEMSEFVYPELFMQIAYDLESVYTNLGGEL